MKMIDKKTSDLSRVAWLYYIEEMTQSQIADKLDVSRSTVIRLLQKARKNGLVTISLGVSTEIFQLEKEIEKKYNLKKVRLVPKAENNLVQIRWLGQIAAETLQKMAKNDSIIAVNWGSTLQAMADSLYGESSASGMQIVALIGGLHNALQGTNPYEVAEQIGQFFNAPARALYAPIYVKTAQTASDLTNDSGVKETLNLARKASLALLSLGALHPDATMLKLGFINQAEQQFLQQQGTVGDIACRWINAQGQAVTLPDTINPIGLSLEEIKAIPQRLVVAGGDTKFEIIKASLLGGYATHLITDEQIALKL